ncbi:DUF1775 domain-containing protein [Streptomyces sp. Rer75]|uniref:DUF1775 domain-containing protein n=1 Tax=Streptomyces sp. Rer75 TaxID=2750011 RepID=UPI0015D0A5EC|nr:DUF1775 domain-containing protein [Streptomyces sp. Rer75]QLH21450.1 DUF1775 domain-containing protein [Streptomyces sp. Rer75]
MSTVRTMRRLGAVSAAAIAATIAFAGPASAHAEVTASNAQALAKDVVLTFTGEAESESGGFTEVRVVLPEGIAPGDVTLDEAPKGWKMKSTKDGYALSGPKLAVGTNAVHKVKVRQLPDAKSLAFKTIETYSDGKVSRWIELPGDGPEPEEPAPVLELKAAAAGAKPAKSPSPSPSRDAADKTSDKASGKSGKSGKTEKKADEEESSNAGAATAIGISIGVLIVAGAGLWVFKQRRSAE